MPTLLDVYDGMENSPVDYLQAGIDADDTELTVTNENNYPAAPCIVSLGTGEDAEHVRVTAKGAGTLTVVRGVSGVAKEWDAGTPVTSYLTAYEWNRLIDNVETVNDAVDDINDFLDVMPTHAMERQAIINGNFDVWQRGTAFTSGTSPANGDDTYLADRWILLSDGADVVDVSRESSVVPAGSAYSLKCDVKTANKKFGHLQIIESVDALKLAGKHVSLSFQARTVTGAVIENLRAAVLSWTGTADTVTSDVVSAWGNEGTDPTLVTNWTYENTPADLALVADEWTTFKIENINIDTSGMKNLAVFVWVDDADAAVGDLLYLSQIQLCEGEVALPFQPKTFAEELQACQRYYVMLTPATTAIIMSGFVVTATSARALMNLSTTMRVTPTLITTGVAADYKMFVSGSSYTCTAVPANSSSTKGFIYLTITCAGSSMTPGYAGALCATATMNIFLGFDAEL